MKSIADSDLYLLMAKLPTALRLAKERPLTLAEANAVRLLAVLLRKLQRKFPTNDNKRV